MKTTTIAISALIITACGAASRSTPAAQPPPSRPQDALAGSTIFNATSTVPILNARMPLPGVLTGGAPGIAQLQEAEQLGYRTIISLLPAAESEAEATAAHQLGLRFVSIPIATAADLTEDNARKLGFVLAQPDARPLILHCASGNRAAALLALWSYYVDRKSVADALALGDAAGLTKLRPNVESALRSAETAR